MSTKIRIFLACMLAGKGIARYLETAMYSDDACQVLDSYMIVAGTTGEDGPQPFGTCIDTTPSIQMYTMNECTNDGDVVTKRFFTDDCTGVAPAVRTSRSSCSNGIISRCTTDEPGWPGASDWTVEATFFSDASCTADNGNNATITKSEYLALGNAEEGCFATDVFGMNAMVRCVGTAVKLLFFAASDTTCSLEAFMGSEVLLDCIDSPFDLGSYVHLECLEIISASGASSLLAAEGFLLFLWSVAVAFILAIVTPS